MNTVKPHVRLYGTRPEMGLVHSIVSSVFARHGHDCTITSGVGKKHMTGSLHPVGFAQDYRTKHIITKNKKHQIFRELKDALPMCDILFEHIGQDQEHYHVEFDDHEDPQFQEDKLYYKKHGSWPNNKVG